MPLFFFNLDRFVLMVLALIVLDLLSSVLSQEIGWEQCLQSNLFCVEWVVLSNSISAVYMSEHLSNREISLFIFISTSKLKLFS